MANLQPSDLGRASKIEVFAPATRERLGEVLVSSPAEVRAAVVRAREAQPAWEALGFERRARFMLKALDHLVKNQDAFIEPISRETGRSALETVIIDVFPACDSLSHYARRAERMLRDERRGMHLLRDKRLVVTYRPLGVIGIITPWNGPFILALNPTVQALMAGNTVVLKPSEVTPLSADLVARLFERAGLPAGVFTVVHGGGATGAALVDSGVDKISFTGSVATGRKIAEACAKHLIPCTLELGGKDPMIVCADADLERAAGGAVFGSFMNAGQFCCGTERVYVVDAVAERFTRLVLDKTRALRLGPGDEYDIGPMIWPRQIEIVERHVADAVKKGARILLGGRRAEGKRGLFFEPTVIADVTHEMEIMREETFGPVLALHRVANEEEAIRLANDSSYGLSATVWTKDSEKGLALAKRVHSGSVCVNDTSITYGVAEAPFGGRKWSGLGQTNGEAGLKGFCFAQPVLIDRLGRKAEPVWYPYTADKLKMLKKAIRWIWGTPLRRLLS
jgi:succinate-semialdehyde dehydrogenase/glutarate-semialdehyde dehydrogenase